MVLFRRRLFKYVVPVILISIIINIPKFFESRVHGEYVNETTFTNEVSSMPQTANNDSMNTVLINTERYLFGHFVIDYGFILYSKVLT